MEKLKIIEKRKKIIDFEITVPKRLMKDGFNANGRIKYVRGEWRFIPRGNNFFTGTTLVIEELEAIISKLKELNLQNEKTKRTRRN